MLQKNYNTINGDLTRSSRIGMNFTHETSIIREKYKNAGYPERFVESVIYQNEQCLPPDSQPLIPEFFFAEPKQFLLLEILFCIENESTVKRFTQKLHQFTQNKFDFATKWVTRKVKQLFSNKDRNPHPPCKIYEGVCSTCSKNYIGETKRNVETR